MTDALFAMGVIADDDRPRQHQPRPVRNLEEEVSPLSDTAFRCGSCGLIAPSRRSGLCFPCLRERQMRTKSTAAMRRNSDRAAERDILHRIFERGWVRVVAKNAHIVDRLIAAGSVRFMTTAEQQRAGLQRFDAVAVLRRSEQG